MVEAVTYRLSDHTTADDASRYRPQAELEAAWQLEPLLRTRRFLEQRGCWDDAREAALRADCAAQIEAAVQGYQNRPAASTDAMFDHLFANPPAALAGQKRTRTPLRHRRTEPLTRHGQASRWSKASTSRSARALADDPDVVLIGEDIGVNGGVFRATAGLQQRFGKLRVQDTPLAEGLIAGMAVGMAAQGLKVVAEIQFMGFLYPALDQIANHMARMRNRTRGRLTCPVVIRMPHGGGIHAPEHHSESLEVLLCHHAGLRVVCPSSPARAYGLLLAAIRDPDPVMFLEPTRLYRMAKQDVLDDGQRAAAGPGRACCAKAMT